MPLGGEDANRPHPVHPALCQALLCLEFPSNSIASPSHNPSHPIPPLSINVIHLHLQTVIPEKNVNTNDRPPPQPHEL